MTKLSPSDFRDHADWIAYVRRCVPENEQSYTLANGRTELFTRLYRARKQSFPSDFEQERQRIETLTDPTRATALDQLNENIFADLTRGMFALARVEAPESSLVAAPTPRQAVEELVQHLLQKNPHFARSKEQRVSGESGLTEPNNAEFASAMADLDKLLKVFWDRDQALPPLMFERVWFLHYLREPERMLQTRAVLSMLTAEILPCTSA